MRSRRSACTPPSPPDAETATSSAHGRQVDREHEQPQRHHPEPEDGQKPYNPAQNQSDPETNPQAARLRQRDLATRKAKRSCLWSLRFVFVGHLGAAPNTTAARRRSEPRVRATGRRGAGSPFAGNPLTRAPFQLGAKEKPASREARRVLLGLFDYAKGIPQVCSSAHCTDTFARTESGPRPPIG